MGGFFSDFATGFAQGGAEVFDRKNKANEEWDLARRKMVMEASLNAQLNKVKLKDEMESKAELQKLNSDRMKEILFGQTQAAAQEAVTRKQQSTVPTVDSATGSTEDLPTDIADDSEMDLRTVKPPVPVQQSDLPPVQNTQVASAEQPAQPTNAPQNNMLAGLTPEQIATVHVMVNDGKTDLTDIVKYANEARKENNKGSEAVKQKNMENEAKINQMVNELGYTREQAVAQVNGIKNYQAPIAEGDKAELGSKYGITDFKPSTLPKESVVAWDKSTWADKEAKDAIQKNNIVINSVKNFVDLNKTNTTGGFLSILPGIKTVRSAFNDEFASMDQETAKLVMGSIKALGSGTAISDSDREFAEKAGVSTAKPGQANEAQAAAMLMYAKVDNEYRDFAKQARSANGSLSPGAIDAAWQEYTNANPVFTKLKLGDIQVNTERLSWQEYFNAKANGTVEEAMYEARQRYTQEKGMPGKPNAAVPADKQGEDKRPSLDSIFGSK